jgi:hypothetical protein
MFEPSWVASQNQQILGFEAPEYTPLDARDLPATDHELVRSAFISIPRRTVRRSSTEWQIAFVQSCTATLIQFAPSMSQCWLTVPLSFAP